MLERRIMGAETEFSVALDAPGEPWKSETAARRVVNEYGTRHRLPSFGGSQPGSYNFLILNGGRYYEDLGDHPEYSAPETADPLEATRYDKGGERLLVYAAKVCAEMEEFVGVRVYKNNTDGGNSWAWHLNMLGDRKVPLDVYYYAYMPFLICSMVISGAGSVLRWGDRATYSISQRAPHFWELASSATTRSRPIFNTRDKPYTNPEKFRRLHLIPLDSNLSEVATFLTIGMAHLVADMAECRCAPGLTMEIMEPVRAFRDLSLDSSLKRTVETNRGHLTALDIMFKYHKAAELHLRIHRQALEPWHELFLKLHIEVLDGLKSDPMSQRRRLMWVLKKYIIEGKADGNYLSGAAARYDLKLGELGPEGDYQKLAAKGKVDRLFTEAEVESAILTPPAGRPYARAELNRAYRGLAGSNWDEARIWMPDHGTRRVFRKGMMDPFGPTAAQVDELTSLGVESLLERFGVRAPLSA